MSTPSPAPRPTRWPILQRNITRLAHQWRWWLPVLALVAFTGTTGGLLWMTYESESASRNEQLITDTLWVKQSISFQLARHEEALRSMAVSLERGVIEPTDFQTKAAVLLRGNRELVRLSHVAADGHLLQTAMQPQAQVPDIEGRAARLALELGREAYIEPALEDFRVQPLVLTLAIPISRTRGALVAIYSLQGILDELVPWWFAQDNEISIANAFGEPLANRKGAAPARGIYRHQTPLDLPGTSLLLVTDSVKSAPNLLPNVLAVAVAALSLTLLTSLMLLWRDVRKRLAAERQLSGELSFRKAMEDSLVTGLRARDMQGRVTYVNPAFCRIVGYSQEELIGQAPPMPYWDAEHFEQYQRRLAQLLAGTVSAEGYETVFRHRDGRLIPVMSFEAPLVDAQGRQTGWMSSIVDLTDVKRIEDINRQQQEKLQSTARLAVMGEMASMLSHELNQPLSAITSYTTGCLNLVAPDDDRLRPAIEKIEHQATRAGQIIRSVHDFVRRREPVRQHVHVQALVDETLPLMQLQARRADVTIVCDIPRHLPPVWVEPVMIEQVLLNLSRNAIEAMTQLAHEQRLLELRAIAIDHGVEMAVIDHGHGLTDEALSRLFTPFFTTKREGMGLGLNICRTAVEFHHGRLWHEPTPGGGATFRFTLME